MWHSLASALQRKQEFELAHQHMLLEELEGEEERLYHQRVWRSLANDVQCRMELELAP